MKQPSKFSPTEGVLSSRPEVDPLCNGDYKSIILNENSHVENQNIKKAIISCLFCQTSFATLSACKCHSCCVAVRNSEKKVASYTCLACKQTFSKMKLLHGHSCSSGQHKCLVCPSYFSSKQSLRKHLSDTHCVSKTIKGYSCKFCKGIFIKRHLFYNHLKKHAEYKGVSKLCSKSSQNGEKYEPGESSCAFLCTQCSQSFERKQQYEQHMLAHKRHICDICKTSFPTKRLFNKHQHVIHGVQTESKKHKCPTCQKMFQRPFHLAVHLRRHTGEKPLQCGLCRKSFCTEQALAKHKKTASHSKKELGVKLEKSFLCEKCGRMFYHQQTLTRHTEQMHSHERYLQCLQCDYKTRYEANLKRHIELHANIKRFICEMCGASFNAQATLKSHHSYVHSEKRDFICEYCSKAFKGKSALQRHLRNHSNERPFKCHCNQSYKRMSHLKRHMSSAHQMIIVSRKPDSCCDEKTSNSLKQTDLQSDPSSIVKADFDSSNEQPSQIKLNCGEQKIPSSDSVPPAKQSCVLFILPQSEENSKVSTLDCVITEKPLPLEKHFIDTNRPASQNSTLDMKVPLTVDSFQPSAPNTGLVELPESLNCGSNPCENSSSSNSFLHFPDYDPSSLFQNMNPLSVSEADSSKVNSGAKPKSTFSYHNAESPSHFSGSGMEWFSADAPGHESDSVSLAILNNSLDMFSSPFIFPNESQVSLQDTIPHSELDLFSTSIC